MKRIHRIFYIFSIDFYNHPAKKIPVSWMATASMPVWCSQLTKFLNIHPQETKLDGW
jgi:hypothetical protein